MEIFAAEGELLDEGDFEWLGARPAGSSPQLALLVQPGHGPDPAVRPWALDTEEFSVGEAAAPWRSLPEVKMATSVTPVVSTVATKSVVATGKVSV